MSDVELAPSPRVRQGDIFSDIEFIEYATEKEAIIEVAKIIFPLVVVLTQDCDLESDFREKSEGVRNVRNSFLISVIVAPVYNFEMFRLGEHLNGENLRQKMSQVGGDLKASIRRNLHPRYHFLTFSKETLISPEAVVDFKHYFTVTVPYLESIKERSFKCKLGPLYREDLSHRFASFLARIGLPNY